MKIKLVLTMLMVIIISCACTVQKETEEDRTEDELQKIDEELDTSTSDSVEEYEVTEQSDTTVAEIFARALSNQEEFDFTDKAPHNDAHSYYSNRGVLSELQYGYENSYNIVSFTVVDLDGDSIPEVVLKVQNHYGYIILHYKDEQILGIGTTYKSFGELKKNGLFMSIAGVESMSINRVYFMGNTMFFSKCLEEEHDQLLREDIVCDETIWIQEYDKFMQEEPVDWYEINEENIKVQILENPQLNLKTSEIQLNVKRRQEQLDSIIYLQDTTYGLYEKDKEKLQEDAIDYYNGCLAEMNKILDLCHEYLNEELWAELEKEQLFWQKNLEQRMSDEKKTNSLNNTEYYIYGDIVFRRIIRLINVYCDLK